MKGFFMPEENQPESEPATGQAIPTGPRWLQLLLFALEEAIRNAPDLAGEIAEVLNKAAPSIEDWSELRARVARKGYFDYVPDSKLPRAD